jgi:hypothetical protein
VRLERRPTWWRCRKAGCVGGARQESLAATVPIGIGRVEQVDAKVQGRFKAANDSASSTGPQVPPMAHAPKLTEETFQPVRPNSRYCMVALNCGDATPRAFTQMAAQSARGSPSAAVGELLGSAGPVSRECLLLVCEKNPLHLTPFPLGGRRCATRSSAPERSKRCRPLPRRIPAEVGRGSIMGEPLARARGAARGRGVGVRRGTAFFPHPTTRPGSPPRGRGCLAAALRRGEQGRSA